MTPRPWQGPQPEPSADELARGWRWHWVRNGLYELRCGEHVAADVAIDAGGCAFQVWGAGGPDSNVEMEGEFARFDASSKAHIVDAVNALGTWGRVVIDEPMCSRAAFEAKVVDVGDAMTSAERRDHWARQNVRDLAESLDVAVEWDERAPDVWTLDGDGAYDTGEALAWLRGYRRAKHGD